MNFRVTENPEPMREWKWPDAIIHRIHLRVLNHFRGLPESAADGRG